MATTKYAIIRYKALDRCFSNQYKRFFINDLIEVCSKAISEYSGVPSTVSRRQIFDDMNFMKSEAGYAAPIESLIEGKKAYYRYEDKQFSIENSPINAEELDQIKDALEIFSRINGLPNFEWMAELETKLRDSIEPNQREILSFDHNQDLQGLEHLSGLYNFIKNKVVLKIQYQSFRMEEPKEFIVHPYLLKQYNNRWFLFGHNPEEGKLQNMALDRIVAIEQIHEKYIDCSINFLDYFEEIVGVTNPEDQEEEDIVLEFNEHRLPYVTSKPIHGSQKLKEGLIHLNLKINREFISYILSFGADVRVIEPENLKIIIKEEAKKIINY